MTTLSKIKSAMKPGQVGWTYASDKSPMVLICEASNKQVRKFTTITDYAAPASARKGAKRAAERMRYKYMGCLHC